MAEDGRVILSTRCKPKGFEIRCCKHAKTGNLLSIICLWETDQVLSKYVSLNAMEVLK